MILSLLVYQLIGQTTMEYVIAFGLIALIGIPHGATDQTLASLNAGSNQRKGLDFQFLVRYLLTMVAYGVCWMITPSLSFLAFMLLSAYHFGEAQLAYAQILRSSSLITMSAGICALLIILLSHPTEMSYYIAPHFLSASVMQWLTDYVVWGSAAILLFFSILLMLKDWRFLVKEWLDLTLIFVITYNTSLIFGFAIYFAFWHSWDATSMQILKIRQVRSGFDLGAWYKEAAPFTLVSWAGLALMVLLFQWIDWPWPLITTFFALVSIITLPHALIMSRFYKTDYTKISLSFASLGSEGSDTPGGKSRIGS